MSRSKKEENAIWRLTNLAQEKNENWLGLTNIDAMEVVLKYIEELEKNDIRNMEIGIDFDKEQYIPRADIERMVESKKREREHLLQLNKINAANILIREINNLEDILRGKYGKIGKRE